MLRESDTDVGKRGLKTQHCPFRYYGNSRQQRHTGCRACRMAYGGNAGRAPGRNLYDDGLA
jgi:hypothetical protein